MLPAPPPYGFSVNSILGAPSALPETHSAHFNGYFYRHDVTENAGRPAAGLFADFQTAKQDRQVWTTHQPESARPHWIPQLADKEEQHPDVDDDNDGRILPIAKGSPPSELAVLQPVAVTTVNHVGSGAAIDERLYGDQNVRTPVPPAASGNTTAPSLTSTGPDSAASGLMTMEDGRFARIKANDSGLQEERGWMLSSSVPFMKFYGHTDGLVDAAGGYVLGHCKSKLCLLTVTFGF
jgi:hypothetical protein